MSETPLIYKNLVNANKAITSIAKGQKNQQQGFMYRGIDDIYNDIHSILADNEIFIVPEVLKHNTYDRQSKSGGTIIETTMEINHHFVTSDGSEVVTKTVGVAMDSGDKGANKAMSIAFKYAIMQMFTIPTNDPKDPDAETHEVKPLSVEDKLTTIADKMRACTTKEELSAVYKRLTKKEQANRIILDCINEVKDKYQ